jgi:hypothetical protein
MIQKPCDLFKIQNQTILTKSSLNQVIMLNALQEALIGDWCLQILIKNREEASLLN